MVTFIALMFIIFEHDTPALPFYMPVQLFVGDTAQSRCDIELYELMKKANANPRVVHFLGKCVDALDDESRGL